MLHQSISQPQQQVKSNKISIIEQQSKPHNPFLSLFSLQSLLPPNILPPNNP